MGVGASFWERGGWVARGVVGGPIDLTSTIEGLKITPLISN